MAFSLKNQAVFSVLQRKVGNKIVQRNINIQFQETESCPLKEESTAGNVSNLFAKICDADHKL